MTQIQSLAAGESALTVAVPEPDGLMLLLAGVFGLGLPRAGRLLRRATSRTVMPAARPWTRSGRAPAAG